MPYLSDSVLDTVQYTHTERNIQFYIDAYLGLTLTPFTYSRVVSLHQAFFWPFEKKLKAKKTQNSRKKLKLKLTTQIFGFLKNSTFSEKMFYPS